MKSEIIIWFKSILRRFCGVDSNHFIKLIFLEIPKLPHKIVNTCISLLATYIVCMWNVRDKRMDSNAVIRYIKGEILMKHKYMKYAMAENFCDIVSQQYYALDRIDI